MPTARHPHVAALLSRAIGFSACGLAASTLQHALSARTVDSWGGLVLWALVLALAAASLGFVLRAIAPATVPPVLTDALGGWAIVGYVRALQLSQDAPESALTPDERAKLGGTTP